MFAVNFGWKSNARKKIILERQVKSCVKKKTNIELALVEQNTKKCNENKDGENEEK